MKNTLSDLKKIKEYLENAAFFVSKGGSEREAYGKILESLVILAKLETQLSEFSSDSITSGKEGELQRYPQHEKHLASNDEKDKEHREMGKVIRKLPHWFKKPSQINSKILISYLELSKQNEIVTIRQLKEQCSSVKDFYGNYNQMKNFGKKNHGKVFEEKDESVSLWEPVKELIYSLYNEKHSPNV